MPRTLTKNRSRENWRRNVRSIAGALLLVVALLGGGYAFLLVQDATKNSQIFHLEGISFSGLRHIQGPALERLILKNFSGNVLSLDLEKVRQLVESEPWVHKATVRRRLPNRLEFYVREREVVAVAKIGKKLRVVDREGVLLETFGSGFSEEVNRPIVNGLSGVAIGGSDIANKNRMSFYLDVLEALAAGGKDYATSLSEVDVTKLGRVRVVPTNTPFPVDLGDTDFLRRYEMFLDRLELIEQVREQHGGIEWVDMSFENRIVVHTSSGGETSESTSN